MHSEVVLGNALGRLHDKYPRSTYWISTKVGRYGPEKQHFDYSSQRIRESVDESLRRLHTSYIDIMICHDVEFVKEGDVYSQALPTLYKLQASYRVRVYIRSQLGPTAMSCLG